jgi:hypothetical protein
MREITLDEVEAVSGGKFIVDYFLGKVLDSIWNSVMAGQVDYSGLAEQNGSNYNMLGS